MDELDNEFLYSIRDTSVVQDLEDGIEDLEEDELALFAYDELDEYREHVGPDGTCLYCNGMTLEEMDELGITDPCPVCGNGY